MQKTEKLAKEFSEFCRKSVRGNGTHKVAQSSLGEAVRQGVMTTVGAALIPSGPSNPIDRTNPWV